MNVLWLHVRNSPIRWALPALIALDLAVLFLRSRYWIGIWPETGAAAQVPAYLLAPLGAGAAAWMAAAPVRHGIGEQLASARVRPAVVEAYRIGAAVAVLTVPYVIGQGVGFALTAWTFPPGLHLWLGYFFLGLFVIFLATSVGWILGRMAGSVFATLSAALGCFLLIAVLDVETDFIVLTGRPAMAPDPLVVALRLGLIVALLVALLWMPASGTFRTRIPKLLLPASVICLLAVTLFGTTAVVSRQPAGDNVVCVDGRASLCIWPEHEKYVPLLEEINGRITAMPEIFIAPSRINEFGIEWTGQIDKHTSVPNVNAAPYFYIFEGSRWSLAGDISTAIMSTTFSFMDYDRCRWKSRSSIDSQRLWALGAWLESYLAGNGAPDYHTNAPREMQDAWTKGRAMANGRPRAEQFQWAEREVNDLRGRYCQQPSD